MALKCRGSEMVSPYKKNRPKPTTQDGCRFKVERFFSWLEDTQRLVVSWEYHAELYLGLCFLHV